MFQIDLHFQDRWANKKGKIEGPGFMIENSKSNISSKLLVGIEAYTRVTLFSLSQVTWNHVQGLTSVGSQLCRTPLGSCKFDFNAFKASPAPTEVHNN